MINDGIIPVRFDGNTPYVEVFIEAQLCSIFFPVCLCTLDPLVVNRCILYKVQPVTTKGSLKKGGTNGGYGLKGLACLNVLRRIKDP